MIKFRSSEQKSSNCKFQPFSMFFLFAGERAVAAGNKAANSTNVANEAYQIAKDIEVDAIAYTSLDVQAFNQLVEGFLNKK